MWNTPTKEDLSTIPKLYETEEINTKDKIMHMHFFLAGCDWYACEWDGEDRFFGYAILNNDFQMSEWGYFSLSELASVKVSGAFEVDRDLHWRVRKAKDVDKICKGMGWPPSKKHIERMLDTSGIMSDACKICGTILDTEPSERTLYCPKCGSSIVKEQFYIGKKMHSQRPKA